MVAEVRLSGRVAEDAMLLMLVVGLTQQQVVMPRGVVGRRGGVMVRARTEHWHRRDGGSCRGRGAGARQVPVRHHLHRRRRHRRPVIQQRPQYHTSISCR